LTIKLNSNIYKKTRKVIVKKQTKKTAGKQEVPQKKKGGNGNIRVMGCLQGCNSTYNAVTNRPTANDG